MPFDEKFDPRMGMEGEHCFARAQACVDIANRIPQGDDDRQLLMEMAQGWQELGLMFLQSDDPASSSFEN